MHTLEKLRDISKTYNATTSGIHWVPNVTLSSTRLASPNEAAATSLDTYFRGQHHLDQFKHIVNVGSYCDCEGYVAPVADMPVYLEFLKDRIVAQGVTIRKIPSLVNLNEIQGNTTIVVNCAGLRAGELSGDAQECFPCQGQVVRIWAPQLGMSLYDPKTRAYMIPRPRGDVICGGSSIDHEDGTEPDPTLTHDILTRCAQMVPAVATSLVLETRVGLRPKRKGGLRLELEHTDQGGIIIHNYGHGGSGFACSWGTAKEVGDLIMTPSRL